MPVTIDGAPTHVLVVHLIVVLLPASVLASLLLVAVPRTRRPFALLTLGIAFIACVAIPFAFLSGSALESRVGYSPLISRHVALAHELLPLAALFGVSLAVFVAVDLLGRSREGKLNDLESWAFDARPELAEFAAGHRVAPWRRAAAVVLVVLAILTGVQVYRVGDAGAKAAWSGRLSGAGAPPGHAARPRSPARQAASQ